MDDRMSVDPRDEPDDEAIMAEKIVNEEYKIWKKNAPFLYDIMLSRALDWPTLTTQWFPDVKESPDKDFNTHRLLLGTHTTGGAANYLQVAHVQIPILKAPDPNDYDAEKEEIGGYGSGKKSSPEMKFNIVQKIDHDGEVNKARYMPSNPDIIATMCIDGRVMIFDRTKQPSMPTGTVNPQIELKGHTKEGFGLNWNHKKEGHLATGSEDSTVRLWDITSFDKTSKVLKPQRTYTHHTAVVNDVDFHPMFDWMIASVSDDLSLQILDTRVASNTTAAKSTSKAHADAINSVAFNPGTETILATGSADKTVAIWDLRNLTMKLHSCENGHRDVVSKVEWHPSEKAIVGSGSHDRRICFWDLSRVGNEQTAEDAEDGPPELLFMHGGHTNHISDFSFNKNDPWLMCSTAEDNLIQVWRTSYSLVGPDKEKVPVDDLEQ